MGGSRWGATRRLAARHGRGLVSPYPAAAGEAGSLVHSTGIPALDLSGHDDAVGAQRTMSKNDADGPLLDPDAIMERMLYRFVDRDSIRKMQLPYVRLFTDHGAKSVLDVGCGRGLFLDLLRESGIDASGIDGNAEAVEECRARGLNDTYVGDALDYLESARAEGRRFDGIFCSHLIEHLPGRAAVRLIASSAALLAPGGRLVIVTPNVGNLHVWTRVFWLDPTHVRPYPRELTEAIMTAVGLSIGASYEDTRGRAGGMRPLGFLRFGRAGISGQDSVVVGVAPKAWRS